MFRLWRINQRENYFLQHHALQPKNLQKDWIIDSGCTNHMTHDKELFKELNKSNISKVRIRNGEQLDVKGTRTISIKIHSNIKLIFDVLYVLDITQNLLSVAQMLEKGYKASFENNVFIDKKC